MFFFCSFCLAANNTVATPSSEHKREEKKVIMPSEAKFFTLNGFFDAKYNLTFE